MIDNPYIELAYVILVVVSSLWALSKIKAAVVIGGLWSWVTAVWMTIKASFFTVAGIIWWTNTVHETALATVLFLLAGIHIVVFVVWLTLPGVADSMPAREESEEE